MNVANTTDFGWRVQPSIHLASPTITALSPTNSTSEKLDVLLSALITQSVFEIEERVGARAVDREVGLGGMSRLYE